jgi:hypothetical protein
MRTQQRWWCGKEPLWGMGNLNPAKDYVELRWNWFEMGLESDLRITINTLAGQELIKHFVSDYRDNIEIIATGTLPPGLYLVHVVNNKGDIIFTDKLTILK